MATNLRLTDWEQEEIRKKSVEINKIRIKNGLQPYKDSEVLHKLLEKTIPCVKASASGEVMIEQKED